MTFYTKNNIKVNFDGTCATLYLTDFGINKHGAITFINMCDEGDRISIEEAFGNAEAAKGVFDFISPCAGVVKEVNYKILESPQSLTQDEFIIKMDVESICTDIMDKNEYESFTQTSAARFRPGREMNL